MENLPALAADSPDAHDAARLARSATNCPIGGLHGERAAAHALRDLQDRAPARSERSTTRGPIARITPHTFRHTSAVHMLEAGIEVNVIREWLGHVDVSTTNRYAEINTNTKLAALRATEPLDVSEGFRTTPIWRTDETLLNWLSSL